MPIDPSRAAVTQFPNADAHTATYPQARPEVLNKPFFRGRSIGNQHNVIADPGAAAVTLR